MNKHTNQVGQCALLLARLRAGSLRVEATGWADSVGRHFKENETKASLSSQHIEYAKILTQDRSHQWMMLRQEGVQKPNPRKDILTTLAELTEEKRREGYRPVLMMDANGDYTGPKGDKHLQEFIRRTGLVDHY